MRNLWQVLVGTAVLAVVVAVGASINKSAQVDPAHRESATFSGGCFWGLQETLRQIPGVIKTTVGYTGGTTPNPTYEQVAGGRTGHVEAVEVVFDPTRLSYDQLLADFLYSRNPIPQSPSTDARHHPTIFYHDDAQRLEAEHALHTINQSGKWKIPLNAEIEPATPFYRAEEYHQDYYQKMASTRACPLP
jgi:methionine-S-sulfoxide reductase